MTKKNNPILSPETLVELKKINRLTGITKAKKIMPYEKSLALKNNKGFYYRIYQIGYSS